MSQPTFHPAKHLSREAHSDRETTSTSATTSRPTQHPFHPTSSPPILAPSPARVQAPAPTSSPVTEASVQSSKATTSPLVPALPPRADKRVNFRAWADAGAPEPGENWADEDYRQLVEDDGDTEQYIQQQQVRRARPAVSYSDSQRLENIAEDDGASVLGFAAAPAELHPVKWSAPLPPSLSRGATKVEEDVKGEAREGAKSRVKDQGEAEKRNLDFGNDMASRAEDESGKEDDEKRFL